MKILINSIPKSGTHLLQKTFTLFGLNFVRHISDASRCSCTVHDKEKYNLKSRFDSYISRCCYFFCLNEIDENCFSTIHTTSDECLIQVLNRKIKPVLIIRDPRAVIASIVPYVLNPLNSNHLLHELFSSLKKEECYRISKDGIIFKNKNGVSTSYYPLLKVCEEFECWMSHPEVVTVKYEDLVGSRGNGDDDKQNSVLIKLATILDLPFDRIDYVKKNIYGLDNDFHFYKGKVDTWKEEFSLEFQQEITEEFEKILKKWGYER